MLEGAVVLVDAVVLVVDAVKVVGVRPERLVVAELRGDHLDVGETVEDEEAQEELAAAAGHAHGGRHLARGLYLT